MGKKRNLIETAVRLFAEQGYDGTTTLQISREAGVTEPLIYYHFKGKEELFTHILTDAFDEYMTRLESLPSETTDEFTKIENLIITSQKAVVEMPRRIRLVMSSCPARIKDADHVCSSRMLGIFEWYQNYLAGCLERGMASGEFVTLPVKETVYVLISMINGMIRQYSLMSSGRHENAKDVAVAFCRRSLVKH
ncbi:MAG: TetR/AcrR family transcriptional regulator [Desulfobacterales bacterium]|nr:TetR/AcrR family transcriptional regulator [Desulfobacterales bacterium]MDJ0853761.1 TetR/AcrR family transcriptional regulator [Desulfobacterales bacterium]MDJ0885727.1 TetR/AcrR family transcriptional regulator [Desulfobacterales bacterium]MDJ0991347.1 TetR/AcrR family transcriptional regulator [Desulfobacterales bacterium]